MTMDKPRKIAVAITGASGAIYAKLLLQKLAASSGQISETSVVMSTNAKEVWKTELQDESYREFPFRFFGIPV